jgi:DNA-binding CsgD family transcriptional regulator
VVPATAAVPVPAPYDAYLSGGLADVNVPAYVIDTSGCICWLNEAGRSVCGDVIGQQFTSIVDMNERDARRIFEHNLETGQPSDRVVSVVTPDQSETTVEISSVRLGDEHHVVGMFGLVIPLDRRAKAARRDSPLTRRQHEVLELLAQGESTDGIAHKLFLSRQTVRNHIRQIMQRLDTHSRLGAVAKARREGLI